MALPHLPYFMTQELKLAIEFLGSKTYGLIVLLHFYHITCITPLYRTTSDRRIKQNSESEGTEMAKEREELKAILMAQEIYMPDGKTPNTTKLNMISGTVIPPLMEAMCQGRENIAPIEAMEHRKEDQIINIVWKNESLHARKLTEL